MYRDSVAATKVIVELGIGGGGKELGGSRRLRGGERSRSEEEGVGVSS